MNEHSSKIGSFPYLDNLTGYRSYWYTRCNLLRPKLFWAISNKYKKMSIVFKQ